jgi:hypothetical protein
MSRCLALSLALAAMSAIPADARADARSSPALEGRRAHVEIAPRRWYGWQVMSADAVALATAGSVALLTDAADGDAGSIGGAVFATGYALGGPTIHALRGHYGRAAGSLALRVGGPLLFGLAGYHLDTSDTDDAGDDLGDSARIGVVIGTAGALLLDWTALAYEPVDRPREASVVPTAVAHRGGFALGLAGHF